MSQKGARYLVLTSRSGAETLKRRGDFIAERILCYLQSLPDVTVCIEAADAASTEAMSTLAKNIDRPLGGCMLMTGLFSDGMFASHTKESYERPFASKTGAFIALESAVDLARLDFLVAFSSASGLFGNPGQTNYAAYVSPSSLQQRAFADIKFVSVLRQCEHGADWDCQEIQQRLHHRGADDPRFQICDPH